MIGKSLDIPFGEFEGTGALTMPIEAQNDNKMQIVAAKSCECQKFSVPLRSQSAATQKESYRAYCSEEDFKRIKSMKILDYRYEQTDALSFMKTLPNDSVKLIITSPPYNIGKEYETTKSLEVYLNEMKPIIQEFYRILSPEGSICWEVGNFVGEDKEIFPLDIYYYPLFKDLGLKLRGRMIWHFEHGLQCQKRFSGRYESILWFTKSESYTFNLDSVRVPSKYPGKKFYKGKRKGEYSGNPNGKNPSDLWELTIARLYDDWEKQIWDIPNVKSNHPEKTSHPCQFPIELVERCVLALTNEGDVVFDPFAGVASSLIAALKNQRKAMGTELKAEYVTIGEQRIKELALDTLKTRNIFEQIYKSNGKESISKIPLTWLQARLDGIIQDEKKLALEKVKIQETINTNYHESSANL